MPDLTTHWVGLAALTVFVVAYAAVMAEEQLHLRKSVPALVAAGLIWMLIAGVHAQYGTAPLVTEAVRHTLLEFAELFLFLLVAMTYVNTLQERGVFDALRTWLLRRRLSLRALFWVTGALAFCLSPIADNLTTALVMGAVVMAVGQGNPRFVALACLNVVVAANAGGAFSPFGDITTLMVWQSGHIEFAGFFPLFLPALVNWVVPAGLLTLVIGPGQPARATETSDLKAGAWNVVVLFLVTITLTVVLHSALHLPPAIGMMFGLGLLTLYSSVFNWRARDPLTVDQLDDVFASPTLLANGEVDEAASGPAIPGRAKATIPVFQLVEKVEWDTLMFFYGVILCVGGLGLLGYLTVTSRLLYGGLGPTVANVLIGLLSAVIDNVPVMFAVLSMKLEMSQGQWLLVTLTAGVGGSLLSIGSAAGVALMGQARGVYTFLSHLRWSWAVAVGYAASIALHLWLNRQLF